MSNIGERLRAVRQARGLTLTALADLAGCTHSYLSQIENSKKEPSRPLVTALASKLVLSETWLLTGEGPRELAVPDTPDASALLPASLRRQYEQICQAMQAGVDAQELGELLASVGTWWEQSSPDQRAWFRVQFAREFPEVAGAGKKGS